MPSSAAISASGDFIVEVRTLYLLGLGEVRRTQEVTRPAHTRHALSAYILAVAAVEASINELFLSEFSETWLIDSKVIFELREFLERQEVVPKLIILPQLAFGKRLSTGQQPIQDMNMLVRLRNELIHYKMSGKTPTFVRDLAQRGIAIQLPSGEGETVGPWVTRVSTLEGITWAHHTACRTVRAVVALFPEEKREFMTAISENFAERHELMFQ